jgi:hypothetical protein
LFRLQFSTLAAIQQDVANSSTLTRFLRLGFRDKFLLAEALVMLAFASLMIRLLPFRRIVDVAQAPIDPSQRAVDVQRLGRAVESWRRRVPWRALCIQSALALHMLLRRRGVGSTLHYGISKPAKGPLTAHVWLSVDGVTIMGGEAADAHVPVAAFPSGAKSEPLA